MQEITKTTEDMPRERILRFGAGVLADYELLAILLRTGGNGKNVLEFAREVLAARGGLVGLLNSRAEDLKAIKGLGNAKSAEIMAVTELAKRFTAAEMRRPEWSFSSPEDVRQYLLIQFKGRPTEGFGALFLNRQNGFLAFEQAATGSAGEVSVPLRRLISDALHHNAAAVILAHNHPGGSPIPSEADKAATRHIDAALKMIEVQLLDHFIVAGNVLVSMREQGGW